MLVDQFIDRTVHRPRTFFDDAAIHVDFAQPCCPVMRRWLQDAADRLPDLQVHPQGTYVCMEGPAFSTRAESRMHQLLGGDVIGMTAMPEARLAREAELPYALVALPTDFDAWKDDNESVGETIIANLQRATMAALAIITEAIGDTSLLQQAASPASTALDGAIWTAPDSMGSESAHWLRLLRPSDG